MAGFGLVFFLALRNLLADSFSVVLLIVAVAGGVMFQVPNLANQKGYEAALISEGVSLGDGDVRIRPRTGASIEHADTIRHQLSAHAEVAAAVPVLIRPGALKAAGTLAGTPIFALDGQTSFRPFRLLDGEPLKSGDRDGVLVGTGLAKRLGLAVGSTVSVRAILAVTATTLDDDDVGRFQMKVRGIVGGTFGAQEALFVDRQFLATEAGQPDTASMIYVYLKDHGLAGALAERINQQLPELQARAWLDDSPYLASSLQASHSLGTVSEAMVVCAVSFPLLALLYISVLNRRRDIGVMAALGFGARDIFAVFLVQALIVGIAGSVFGCLGGYGLILYFQSHPIFEWQGFVILPVLERSCFLQPVLIAIGAAIVAGVYPAFRASRQEPAPVFRGIT
ncbi:MAG TPA: FtsX-like permease family protein [Polyangiaceae bacterium]|nr:FtsX-like permease family protein [Polyangiaceae bacterium]